MSPPIDELYFQWLYSQVGSLKIANPSKTYWTLLKKLFTKEFIWIVPNDDNRAEDGRALRKEFLDEVEVAEVDPVWMRLGCSILELLIGISRRLNFEDESRGPDEWFWCLIENLSLKRYNDRVRFPERTVDEILDALIWRTYEPDGHGGLFPLRTPRADQRDVEIWYQLSAYLLENGY